MKKYNYLGLIFSIFCIVFFACQPDPPSHEELTDMVEPILVDSVARRKMDQTIAEGISYADSLRKRHKQYDEAIESLKSLLSQRDISKASIKSKSDVFHKIGVNSFAKGDYEKAIAFLDTTIDLRIKDTTIKKDAVANSLFIRAWAKQKEKRNKDAVVDFLKAIEYVESYPEDFSEKKYNQKLSQYFIHTANAYRELGDIGEANKFYEAARIKTEEVYGETHRVTGGLFSSMGVYYVGINDSLVGFKMYDKALNVFKQLGEEKYGHKILDIKNNIAAARIKFKDFRKARKILKTIESDLEKRKDLYTEKEYTRKMLFCFANLGYVDRELQNYESANKHYAHALLLAQKNYPSNYGIEISMNYEGLGDVDLAQKNYASAIANYQKATQALCLDYAPKNDFSLPLLSDAIVIDKVSLKRVLALKAETLKQAYADSQELPKLQAAYQTYQALDTLIAQVRQSYQSDLSRYDIIAGTIPIYEKATQISLLLHKQKKEEKYLEAAFNFSSKNKAIVLLEDRQDEEAKFAGIPTDLLDQEKTLKKIFYDIEEEIFNLENEEERQEAEIEKAKQERFNVSRDYEKLIALFEEEFPAYHELKYTLTDAVDIQQLRQKLPAKSAIIEYFIGLNQLFVFSLTPAGLTHHVVSKPKNFDEQCRAFREISTGTTNLSLEEYGQQAHDLYRLLLEKPLQDLAAQNVDRLFIIPDDYLYELSFDALLHQALNEEQKKADWGITGLPYLVNKYAISYAYSNRLLFDQEDRQQNKKIFAGFGLDYREEQQWANVEKSATRSLPRNWRGKIRPLPYAVEEVENIGKLLDGDTWLNTQATKANFLQHAPEYKILHLAMHGLVEKDFPINSALIFDRQIDSTDFLLTAGDLYSYAINADMVVLSACDTGTGQLQKGEGAMTLARAFKYAGCPSLVASLWSAADEPTKELMIGFYTYLQEGLPKDVALQKAKMDYLGKGLSPQESQPYFWSHIAVIGDTQALDFGGGFWGWFGK